jgi:hypothetical protein
MTCREVADSNTVERYVLGRLNEDARREFEEHYFQCFRCLDEVQALQFLRTALKESSEAIRAAEPVGYWARIWAWKWIWAPALALALVIGLSIRSLVRPSNAPLPRQAAIREKQIPAAPEAGPGATSAAVVIMDTGRRLVLDARGQLEGIQLDAADRKLVETALRSGRIELAGAVNDVLQKNGPLLGASGAGPGFRLLRPVGTLVESERPVFRWKPVPGAIWYEAGIYDENFDPVLESGKLSGTEWRPANPLRRGDIYSWGVIAHISGEEAIEGPRATFRVLPSRQFIDLQRERAKYGDSLLVMGALYARAGLLDDSERAWSELARQNPDSKVVSDLLSSIRALRP